ncbi:hypothetical protein Psta_3723 [Pirellula staleyi DSM 6068]|uniref:Uncharacterized protein n=1 Tax=Pirellula staleyi (strain ATCC 27377 / DSM 6068 / ICPB 4128) TaxID=530564 RepID=D2R013_PIRSD|nr:hypothetical protein [Pirellula staleyi]ADB18378.1 hypothetical protein Psta_3723 [Pirellula staleyi DSM 6068]
MGKKRTKRRQSHGSAWHWKQTDAWYAILPEAKKRVPLLDESGNRIRGKDNREAAIVALARMKVNWGTEGTEHGSVGSGDWIVARVCSEYLQYCDKGVAKGTLSKGHRDNSASWLNDLCKYCGALPVSQLKKGHITS